MKKIVVMISAALLTLGIMFGGYSYVVNQKIYKALDNLKEVTVVYNGQIINEDNIEVYQNSYGAKEEEIKSYLKYVNEKLYPEVFKTVRNLKYKHIKEITGESELILGLMNKDDSISVYFYNNGEVLVDLEGDFYGFKTDEFNKVKTVLDTCKQEISNNPEFGWYLLF